MDSHFYIPRNYRFANHVMEALTSLALKELNNHLYQGSIPLRKKTYMH